MRALIIALVAIFLITFFFLANIFFSPIQILGNQYNQALTAMAGAERVFGLLDRPPDWQDAPDAQPLPAIRGQVELRGVTFGYDADRIASLRAFWEVERAMKTVRPAAEAARG